MSVNSASPPDPIERWEVLELLTSLVQKSLVVYEEDEEGRGRYRLLESVRQYARDRHLATGGADAVRGRHRDWFLALAEAVEEGLQGADEQPWLERLEREHDNLRAALAWSAAQREAEAGLRLGGAMGGLWQMRGYFGEGRELLAELLALPGAEARTAARAKSLSGAGILAWHQGDDGEAGALLEESLAIYSELGDTAGIAGSLWWQAHLAKRQRDYGAARALFEESLAIAREREDKRMIGACFQGLGEVAHLHGINREARALLEESLAVFRELGMKNSIAWSFYHLAGIALSEEDYRAARALLVESLAIFQNLGHKRGPAYDFGRLAAVATAQAQFEVAARLFGAAERLRIAIGSALSSGERIAHDGSVAAARSALGEVAFNAAWADGRKMSLDQAVECALAEGEAPGRHGE